MMCEEWNKVSRDKFLLPSSIRLLEEHNKKNQFLTKRWQFVMDLQNSLPTDSVDERNISVFRRRLDS